ncbi:hypothetical protein [Rhodococcus pseudokoreensis]|uniref:hypothetical protein n=1 Tax=Rhodococcus pseudokoreensis TaxID=2811421 RepID=UPI001F1234C8|nr:hypothetical protein [Rhodococcus pseudokoreensis]
MSFNLREICPTVELTNPDFSAVDARHFTHRRLRHPDSHGHSIDARLCRRGIRRT